MLYIIYDNQLQSDLRKSKLIIRKLYQKYYILYLITSEITDYSLSYSLVIHFVKLMKYLLF